MAERVELRKKIIRNAEGKITEVVFPGGGFLKLHESPVVKLTDSAKGRVKIIRDINRFGGTEGVLFVNQETGVPQGFLKRVVVGKTPDPKIS